MSDRIGERTKAKSIHTKMWESESDQLSYTRKSGRQDTFTQKRGSNVDTNEKVGGSVRRDQNTGKGQGFRKTCSLNMYKPIGGNRMEGANLRNRS